MSKIFKAKHADTNCKEKICLSDYETAFDQHQRFLFQRFRDQSAGLPADQFSLAGDFEKFRNALWGAGSYASRIYFRVTPEGRISPQNYSLEDIAAGGEIQYADIKGLMDLGRVELVVPGYFCGAHGFGMQAGMSLLLAPGRKFSKNDFAALIHELDELRPLHGEGMGNAFWFRCVDPIFPTPTDGIAGRIAPVTLNLAKNILSQLTATAMTGNSEDCHEDDIAYFDVDAGKAVCETYEEDDDFQGEESLGGAFGAMGQGLLAGTAGHAGSGVMYFSTFGARQLGAAVFKASFGEEFSGPASAE